MLLLHRELADFCIFICMLMIYYPCVSSKLYNILYCFQKENRDPHEPRHIICNIYNCTSAQLFL